LILVSESFVFEDFLDGSLSELQFLGYSEESIFLSKCLVMFMSLIIPNIFLIPISSILFEINFLDVIELTTLFIVSLPTITLISILSAFFSLQVKRNKFIQFILILPFFIPIIIFATSENFFVANLGNEFKILVLIGLFLITLPLSILVGKLIIKELNY
jgi:heme exporter protein B